MRSPFTDVPETHWAKNNIVIGTWLGLVKGDPEGTFRPNEPITRAEAVTVTLRAVGVSALFAGSFAAAVYLLATSLPRRTA